MIVKDDSEGRERARRAIAAGGVVAFRTDTLYGLGADPFNQHALRAIFDLKGREENKPILVIISDAKEAGRFIESRTKLFEAVAAKHWPGALTLIAKARRELAAELTAGTGTIGVRLPDDAEVRAFARACGGALTATSANRSGEKPARTAIEAHAAFPQGLALTIDGGAARTETPSTVLDVSGNKARLLRAGVITRDEIAATLLSTGERLVDG